MCSVPSVHKCMFGRKLHTVPASLHALTQGRVQSAEQRVASVSTQECDTQGESW